MSYKITEQYARGEENPIAEFSEINDAKLFITKKSAVDDEQDKQIIYRLYDDSELLQEVNKKRISIAYAKYAEGDCDIQNSVRFSFNVKVQPPHSLERKNIAALNDKNDAELFIIGKCESDETIDDTSLFLVLKENLLMDTLSKHILANRKKETGGSSGNETGSTFRPTPLSSRPTPPGGPSDYWVDNEDDEKK